MVRGPVPARELRGGEVGRIGGHHPVHFFINFHRAPG